MQAFVAAVVPTTVTTTRVIVLQSKCDHGTERRKRSTKADRGDNEHQWESEQTEKGMDEVRLVAGIGALRAKQRVLYYMLSFTKKSMS